MTQGTAISKDGTRIAFWREGQGFPMLLVHGGACDHMAWYFVVPLLARDFEVYTYDRRGRGGSGGTSPYAVEREVEDVLAMLEAIGQPAHLIGHSAGGILALEAAEQTDKLLSLTLYEPAFVVPGARERPNPEILEQMNALLAIGDRAGVVRIAIRETLELPEAEIAAMESGPGWEQLCSVANAIPNDWLLWDRKLEMERLNAIQTEVLLLMGSESPSWLKGATMAIRQALPEASFKLLNGQGHSAMITDPGLFARTVIEFADATEN